MRHCNPILNLLCVANVVPPVSSSCHPAISLTAKSCPKTTNLCCNSQLMGVLSWLGDAGTLLLCFCFLKDPHVCQECFTRVSEIMLQEVDRDIIPSGSSSHWTVFYHIL